jgi:hypothetical protein
MISLQSIAVAAAATGLPASDEARLFRFTLKHSLVLVTAIGLIVALYAVTVHVAVWGRPLVCRLAGPLARSFDPIRFTEPEAP